MSVFALLGNPMNGRMEGWRVVAYFTTRERAVAYEAASMLPDGEYSEEEKFGPGEHYAGAPGGTWRYTYRKESLLRDCNRMPEHATSYQDARIIEVPDVVAAHPAPLNPELPPSPTPREDEK